MARNPAIYLYAVLVAVSFMTLAVGIHLKSPPLISSSAVSVLLGILYLAEAVRFGRYLIRILPALQLVFNVLALILTCTFDSECYPGFIIGTISYPVLGFNAIISLIAYAGLKFYRELIAVFTLFFALSISSFTGVVIYMLYHSMFDVTVNNALNTQEFAFGFVWSIIFSIVYILQQKRAGSSRFFDSERVLEVSE